jgi:putative oxidoreductase
MIARAQDGTLLAARLLLAAALLPTGIARALNVSGFALTLAGNGMPFPNGVATAAVVKTATAVVIHDFWHYIGPTAVAERTLMLADLGLAGGFLIYALTGPGAWSWQGWRAGAMAPAPSAKPAAKTPAKSSAARGGGKRTAGRQPARAAA